VGSMNNPKALIIDYGMGNLLNIERAIKYLGGEAEVSSSASMIASAERLILPGVGAFGKAMVELNERGICDAIYDFIRKERPLLGICLGMQLLMTESAEFGPNKGLDIVSGKVVQLKGRTIDEKRLKVPHIGWNTIEFPEEPDNAAFKGSFNRDNTILKGISSGSYFYFVHSYICQPDNQEYVLAESTYGADRFCSIISNKSNINGCQFHPEKSGRAGLQIYKNFLFNS